MKIVSLLVLSCSLLSTSFLLAQQQQPKACTCKNCKCTAESNCGCLSNQGCTCGDNCSCSSNSNSQNPLLGFNEANLHHGNPDEHDDDDDES
jgi:hypothetical protein